MPWQEVSTMSLRREFVMLASCEEANIAQLSARFRISRKTGYKWLARFDAEGAAGLVDRSRRPACSPGRTAPDLEEVIVRLRAVHPAWGARKLRRRLLDLGQSDLPAPSTLQAILRRHGLLDKSESLKHRAFTRFEQATPNALWQMDYKGHVAMVKDRLHPLTVLDDHSRYNLTLAACGNEQTKTVKAALTSAFRCYGLPERILSDNGSPWGNDETSRLTPLGVWLLHLDIGLVHARPYHPQTLGKDERFHRSLKRECLQGRTFASLEEAQAIFDRFRECYNFERPHEALNLEVPASRYRPSPRSFPETLPVIEYNEGESVRKVQDHGVVNYRGHTLRVPKALKGYRVALREAEADGQLSVYFRHHHVATIDLHELTR